MSTIDFGGGSVTSETMSGTRSPVTGLHANTASSKALIAGMALMAAGGLISLCGMAVSSTALAAAIRRWVVAQQEPPSMIVKRKIAQAKEAAAAGASAWQDGMATQARSQ
jgi:hypothetical protein